MIAPEQLSELYLKRRSAFTDQFSDTNNKIIQDKLLQCALTVDLVIQTSVDLGSNLSKAPKCLKNEMADAIKAHDEMVAILKESFALVETIKDEGLRKSQLKLLEGVVEHHRRSQDLRQNSASMNLAVLDTSIQAALLGIPELMTIDNSGPIHDAVKKLVLNLISLVPFVGGFTGLVDAWEIIDARRSTRKTATEYLDSMDDFLLIAHTWCGATQMLIDLIGTMDEPVGSKDTPTYEVACERVHERFKRIVSLRQGDKNV